MCPPSGQGIWVLFGADTGHSRDCRDKEGTFSVWMVYRNYISLSYIHIFTKMYEQIGQKIHF